MTSIEFAYYEREDFPEISVPQRYVRLVEAFEINSKEAVGADPILEAFYTSMLTQITEGEVWPTLLKDFLQKRPEVGTSHALYLVQRSVQDAVMSKHSNYPDRSFELPATWDQIFDEIIETPDLQQIVTNHLHHDYLKRNVADRYKTQSYLFKWMEEAGRIGKRAQILDIGSSQNHGQKKLALVGQVAGLCFSDTVVYEPAVGQKLGSGRVKRNSADTERIQYLQSQALNFGIGVGIDADDMTDPRIRQWARSNFSPEELRDVDLISEYDWLDECQPPNVTARQLNLLNAENSSGLFDPSADEDAGYFDMVTLYTTLYQMSDRQRRHMLRIARRYTGSDGIVAIQDFVRVNEDAPSELEFFDTWTHPYTYRLIILDMRKPTEYQEVLLMDSGRARKMQIGLGKLALDDGSSLSFRDFLSSVNVS